MQRFYNGEQSDYAKAHQRDKQVEKLLSNLTYYDLVACSDHGEVMGENGLWGHSFTHSKVLEVPLLIRAW